MQPQYPQQHKSRSGLLVVVLVFLALLVAGTTYYQVFTFHQKGTDPGLSSVSNISPYLKVSFNKDLDPNSLQLSDPSHIVTSKSVKDKEITLNFSGNLSIGKTYVITIVSISSKGGKIITNHVLKFTAKDIPSTKLSKDQQATQVSRQDQYPYEVENIDFVGFGVLTDNGMSATQLQQTEQSLYYYSQTIKQKYWTMTLVKGSTQVQIHDSNSDNTDDSQTFSVQLGKNTLKAVATYSYLDDSMQLQLYANNGTLLYDSANAHD